MKEYKNKVAVITGGASGIGRAVSEQLAGKGCILALVDIDEVELRETAQRIIAGGGRAEVFIADVADRECMARLPDRVVEAFGAVQILVNNAGVTVGAVFAEQSLEDFDWIIDINLQFSNTPHGMSAC